MLRLFWRLIQFVLILVVVLPLVVVAFVLEKQPNAVGVGAGFDPIASTRDTLSRFDPRDMPTDKTTTVTASEAELNAALSVAFESFPSASANVALDTGLARLNMSAALPLPKQPLGNYVNLTLKVQDSTTGLEFSSMKVGRLSVPRPVIRPMMVLALRTFLGAGKGEPAFQSVKAVRTTSTNISVGFQPSPTLVGDVRAAAKRVIATGDRVAFDAYFAVLEKSRSGAGSAARVSLAAYTGPVFKLAQARSKEGDAVAENRAAILALATFFGDERFESFVGGEADQASARPSPNVDFVKLDGRHDWVQHFVISAGLTLIGNSAFSNLIGEGKEVIDSEGPSGFSFTDVGADRAGTRFAAYATRTTATARKVQDRMALASTESVFFPEVSDLPEGLSEAEFKSRYGDKDSLKYRQVIQQIDARLNALPLYR